jgi:hypothetical protein
VGGAAPRRIEEDSHKEQGGGGTYSLQKEEGASPTATTERAHHFWHAGSTSGGFRFSTGRSPGTGGGQHSGGEFCGCWKHTTPFSGDTSNGANR